MSASNTKELCKMIFLGQMSVESLEESFNNEDQLAIIGALFSDSSSWILAFHSLALKGHDPKKMMDRASVFIYQAAKNNKYDAVFAKIQAEKEAYESRPRSYSHRSYQRHSGRRSSYAAPSSRPLSMANVSPNPPPRPVEERQKSEESAEGTFSPPRKTEESIEGGAVRAPHEEPYIEGVPAPGYEPKEGADEGQEIDEPGAGPAIGEPEPMEDEFQPGLPMADIAPGGPPVPVEGETA